MLPDPSGADTRMFVPEKRISIMTRVSNIKKKKRVRVEWVLDIDSAAAAADYSRADYKPLSLYTHP